MTDDDIISGILKREGGDRFTDRADDAGGPTKFGITLKALRAHLGADTPVERLKDLTEAEARSIYRADYLVKPGIDKIQNQDVRMVVLDAAVNHGPGMAIRLLQRALGIRDDGVIGSVTLAALPYLDGKKLAVRVLAQRARLYGRIVSRNLTDADKDGIPDATEMNEGWMNRLADLLEQVV